MTTDFDTATYADPGTDFERMPVTEEVIAYDDAKVYPGTVSDTFVLVVRGVKGYLNMEVRLAPVMYVMQPEYWEIRVVGSNVGVGLPATEPYSVFLPLDSVRGIKGIEVVGKNKKERIDVPGKPAAI
jgi:hypothetical protein